MNMRTDATASTTSATGHAERETNLIRDSRNSAEGGEYFHPSPNGDIRVTVSTNDRAEGSTNGNRAEVHNQQFGTNQANDFESWFTVHQGHSFSVAQLLNFGTDGGSPDLMFTVEKGAEGQPNMLVARGRGVETTVIGPLPPNGHFGIKMQYDGAGNFTAQVYTGTELAPVPLGLPISGKLSGGGPLQFRAGVYFNGFNDTQAYPEGTDISADVVLHTPSTAFRMQSEQHMSGSSL